jgi:hypothetical protein
VVIEILDQPEGPLFRATQQGELAALEANPVQEHRLVAVREGLWGIHLADMKVDMPVWFYQLDAGGRYIHFSGRATRKVS